VTKQYTEQEVKTLFLKSIKRVASYWANVEDSTVKEKCEGTAFSILAILDGCNDLPGFIVAPHPCPGDKEFLQGEDQNWFPENDDHGANCDIAGELHSSFHKV